ncbi:MAG: signal peptidase I [Pyrinomonadaceae bacterium]|nr:signal peptidase I [Pyrinomonadaceae bacterium]
MFGLDKKNFIELGIVSADDDRDIEVQHLKAESRRGLWSEVGSFVRDILFVLTVVVLLGVFVVQPVAVEGTSMQPQLQDGERLLVNKLIYYKSKTLQSFGFPKLERDDVVVFWYPNDPDKSYVKRIIGLPGEIVEIKNGFIYVNDKKLDEPFIAEDHNQGRANMAATRVNPHYYFVMGDNRDNSSDSRIWGQVPEKYIYGKVVFRYYPFSGFGFIQHGTSNVDATIKNETKKTIDESNDISQ